MSDARIYLDNASTTPVLPEVVEAMRLYWTETFGNAASAHRSGSAARRALDEARASVAESLGALPEEVIFTSGATEANNLAIFGLAGQLPGAVVFSPLEHPSVVGPCERLGELGFALHRLAVDRFGTVDLGSVPRDLGQVRLMTMQMANHEVGTVQDVAGLVGISGRIPVHTDATQAVGKLSVRFKEMGVASLACSAHKFFGPKGIGVLIVRRGVKLQPLHYGGHQQGGNRPGTEPVALAVGMAAALRMACDEMETRTEHCRRLRQRFLEILRAVAGPMVVNRDGEAGLPQLVNISFPGCRADLLLIRLDLAGVDCATGSACSSGSLLPSPVLQAMELPAAELNSAMRFSLSHLLTVEQVEEAARRIGTEMGRLRGIE